MNKDEVTRSIELHPWRTGDLLTDIAEFCEREGIPFCMECGDWHTIGADHSATDVEDDQ